MIRNPLTRAIAAALVVAAAMAIAPAEADAADAAYAISYGSQHIQPVPQEITYRHGGKSHKYSDRRYYGNDRYAAPRYRRGGHGYSHRPVRWCKPGRAVNKARRIGVHRAHVGRISHRRIVVTGYRHGRHVGVVFARASRHCRIIASYGI